MKSLIKAVAVALVLSAPVASFSQSAGQPLTRAQVRADLDRVVSAGYRPTDWRHYPDNIQTAEAKIAAQDAGQNVNQGAEQRATAQAIAVQSDATGVGGTQSSSESGHRRSGVTRDSYSPPAYEHN